MAGAANPQMAAPAAPGGNVFQQAAGLYGQAAAGPNIGQFMNPYTSQVIGRTGMDMARQAQIAQNQLGAQATQAGAFGGSRHGVSGRAWPLENVGSGCTARLPKPQTMPAARSAYRWKFQSRAPQRWSRRTSPCTAYPLRSAGVVRPTNQTRKDPAAAQMYSRPR